METSAAEQWLYGRLTGDTALTAVVSTRVWNTRRPSGGTFPAVLFQLQPGGNEDLTLLGAVRVWAKMTYLVRGIVEVFDPQGSFEGNSKTIADRIDAVLHGASGTNAGGTVYTCVRLRPFKMAELVGERDFRHLGGIYQIQAR
jgi:hypothetical protein